MAARGQFSPGRSRLHELATLQRPWQKAHPMKHSLRTHLTASLALALAALFSTTEAGAAQTKHRSHSHETRVLVCKDVRKEANKGTVVGAVEGGVLGNVVAGHGSKTAGTVIGAGAGAVAGHQIAKKQAKRNRECHYEYRRR